MSYRRTQSDQLQLDVEDALRLNLPREVREFIEIGLLADKVAALLYTAGWRNK